MIVFADLILEPVSMITWLAVGLLVGWLAAAAMRGSGYSITVDMILGVIGAVIGGCLAGVITTGPVGFVSNLVGALLGTCILITFVRFVAPGESRL